MTHRSRTEGRHEGRHERSILGERQPSASRRDMELEDERSRTAANKNIKKKKRKNAITANLSGTRYDVSK